MIANGSILSSHKLWAHLDEDRIISDGFRSDWRKADIRFEHELQGYEIAKRVQPGVGYSDEFIARITVISNKIETRATELSLTNTLENGSPVAETLGAATNTASIFRYFATMTPELEADDVRPFTNTHGESLVRKDPSACVH